MSSTDNPFQSIRFDDAGRAICGSYDQPTDTCPCVLCSGEKSADAEKARFLGTIHANMYEMGLVTPEAARVEGSGFRLPSIIAEAVARTLNGCGQETAADNVLAAINHSHAQCDGDKTITKWGRRDLFIVYFDWDCFDPLLLAVETACEHFAEKALSNG